VQRHHVPPEHGDHATHLMVTPLAQVQRGATRTLELESRGLRRLVVAFEHQAAGAARLCVAREFTFVFDPVALRDLAGRVGQAMDPSAIGAQHDQPRCLAVEPTRRLQAEPRPFIGHQVVEQGRLALVATAGETDRLVDGEMQDVGRRLDELVVHVHVAPLHPLARLPAGLAAQADAARADQGLHGAASAEPCVREKRIEADVSFLHRHVAERIAP